MSCRNCDDDSSLENVCKKCFDSMINQTDALKKYGMTKEQLENIFSISFVNQYRRRTRCHRYFEDDLYDYQNELIKTLPKDDKQLEKLLECKKKLDEIKSEKINFNNRKAIILKMAINALNKTDSNYLKLYDDAIKNLVEKYYDSPSSVSDIVACICETIENRMIKEKNKNIILLAEKQRAETIDKFISSKFKESVSKIIVFDAYKQYVVGDIELSKCKREIKKYVDYFDRIEKEKIERQTKVDEFINNEYTKKYVNFVKKLKIYKEFVKLGDLKCIKQTITSIKKIVRDAQDLDKRSTTIKKLMRENKILYGCADATIYELMEKYMGMVITSKQAIKYMIRFNSIKTFIESIQEILKNYGYQPVYIDITCDFVIKHPNKNSVIKAITNHLCKIGVKKWIGWNDFKRGNPVQFAGRLCKDFKEETDAKLFKFYDDYDDDDNNVLYINNVLENQHFFIIKRCDQLNFNYEIEEDIFIISKRQNVLNDDLSAELKKIKF
jgi:hypothetical protein